MAMPRLECPCPSPYLRRESGELARLLAEDGEEKGESPGEDCMRRFVGLEMRAWYSACSLLRFGVPGGVDHLLGEDEEAPAASSEREGSVSVSLLPPPPIMDMDKVLRPLKVLQWDSALSWRQCPRAARRPPPLVWVLVLVLVIRPSTVVAPSSMAAMVPRSSIASACKSMVMDGGRTREPSSHHQGDTHHHAFFLTWPVQSQQAAALAVVLRLR